MGNLTEKIWEFASNINAISRSTSTPPKEISEKFYSDKVKSLNLSGSNFWKKFGYDKMLESVLSVSASLPNNVTKEELSESMMKHLLSKAVMERVEGSLNDKAFAASSLKNKNLRSVPMNLLKSILDALVSAGSLDKCSSCKYKLKEDNPFGSDILTDEYRADLENEKKNYKYFLITTAVSNKDVNEEVLNTLRNIANRKNAMKLVFPSDIGKSNRKKGDDKGLHLDPRLADFKVIFKDLWLNKNLCLCTIKTSAKQIKPITSLKRTATEEQASIIMGSTKLFEENVPCKKGKIPLRIATTGAVTVGNYDTEVYMEKRTSYIAGKDHAYGAALVEIIDDNVFNMRILEVSKENTITDLGIEYFPDGSIKKDNGLVMVLGDSHTDMLDKKLHDAIMDTVDTLGVKELIVHDLFHGTSISHHDDNKLLTKIRKAKEHKLLLEDEGLCVKNYLEVLKRHVESVVIVRSNHDDHLDRYLEEGKFMKDPINGYLGLELAKVCVDGENPLRYLVEDILGGGGKGVTWLKQDESYMKYGIELGIHGDKGANGGRGSLTTFEQCVGNCVTAHTHAAQRLRKACCVGTIAELDQGYNKGLSSWSRTCCICNSNGTKQLVHYIPDGKGGYVCGAGR